MILGIIQGLTEFFPVSSSGHLVIAQKLLGLTENQVGVSVVLHLGTGLALLVFFFKDLLGLFKDIKMLTFLFIATLITAVIGLAGKDFFESLFDSPKLVAIALIITGIILIITKKFMAGQRNKLNLKDGVIFGLTQSIAIIPGISRSGITISTLLFRKIEPKISFKVSFLAAIPAIFGAAILEARNIDFAFQAQARNLCAGFIFSFLTGLFSLSLLKIILKKAKLHYFGYYCILIALITLLFVR